MSIKYPPELIDKLIDVAEAMLENALDCGTYGPEEDGCVPDSPRDEDGDPWYWDFWELRNVLREIEDYKKLSVQIAMKAEKYMGADYFVTAVIGVRIPTSELMPPEESVAPGCEHGPVSGNYCSECGAPATKTVVKEYTALHEEVETTGEFRGIPVVFDTDKENAYLGICTRSVGVHSEAERVAVSGDAVDVLRGELEQKLGDLWDATSFGLWPVLQCWYY